MEGGILAEWEKFPHMYAGSMPSELEKSEIMTAKHDKVFWGRTGRLGFLAFCKVGTKFRCTLHASVESWE